MTNLIVLMAALSITFAFVSILQWRDQRALEDRSRWILRGIPASPNYLSRIVYWLGRKKRRWEVERSLPNFFDLLALGLSSGLNFSKSLEASAQFLPAGILQRELKKTNQLMRTGASAEAAFQDLSQRLQTEAVRGSFCLLLQSLQRGSPLHEVLLDQSAALRRAQMRALEKKAQTIGLRLLFPIMVFIFPTIFILLFGMLYLSFLQNGSLF